MKFGVQIDAQGIPVKNLAPESGTAFPASPFDGQMFYRTDQKKFYINAAGLGWQQCDNQGVAAAVHLHSIADVTGLTAALAAKVDSTRTISPGTGLSGGGDLSANRTLSVDFAPTGTSSATQAVRADDSRLSDSRTPKAHTHVMADVTDLAPALALKADKTYVDNAVQGIKASLTVDFASTANVNLDSFGTGSHGIVPASGMGGIDTGSTTLNQTLGQTYHVLLKDQTNPAENGLYVVVWRNVGGVNWVFSRIPEMDAWTEVPGTFVFVEQGTTNGDTGWLCTADPGGTIDTTAMPWTQFSAAGQIVAGAALTKVGQTLNVNPDNATIEVFGNALRVKTMSIRLGPYDGTEHVTGVLPIQRGGTGDATAAGARVKLGALGKFTANLPALTAGQYTAAINHSMSTNDIGVTFIEVATNTPIQLDWIADTNNTVKVKADVAFAANAIRMVVTA